MAILDPPGRPLPVLRTSDTIAVEPDERIWRIYRQGGDHPVTWDQFRQVGPLATMRFDHHSPPRRLQDRGILYGAIRRPPGEGRPAPEACLAEAFHDTRTIDPHDRTPWIVAFTPTAPLALLDLTGAWPTRANANQAISSGDRRRSRQWAQAIYDDYPDLDGIHYTASNFGPGHSVAVFERATDRMPSHPTFHRPLSDPGLRVMLDATADFLGYSLI
jgi:hypothetical protein